MFDVVLIETVKNRSIYAPCFTDEIKKVGTPQAFEKSRLMIQGYGEKSHGLLAYATIVLRVSQRILIYMAAMFPEWKVFLRDVQKAYTQSETGLTRDVFILPPQ